jgi:iron complex transport system ATP-binding protein
MIRLDVHSLTVERGGKAVVSDVSLALPERGLVGILGPNGAGKSTLARMLAGQPGTRRGSVLIGGEDIAILTTARRAGMVGFMPQAFAPHWDITAGMLVEMGASRRRDLPHGAVRAALDAEGLLDLAERPWSTLSGGEKARALLAAVTIGDPPLLVADEPGASLDIRWSWMPDGSPRTARRRRLPDQACSTGCSGSPSKRSRRTG